MTLSSTNEPTVYGLGGSGGIPSKNNVVLTYPMAATASLSRGDFVKLSSATAGTVDKCTATSDNPIGIAFVDVDNTSGAASDKYAPVLRQGFAYVDAVITASGTYDEPITIDSAMYLAGSAQAAADVGQRLTATTDTAVGTVVLARAFDAVTTPSTTAVYKIRVYIDRLSKAVIVE